MPGRVMAVVVHKAMGQHEQRTLHPFFMKHGSEPIAELPQLADPLPKQPSNNPRSERANIVLDSTSEDCPNPLDDDENLSRRKRRKTTPLDHSGNAGHGAARSPPVEPEVTSNLPDVPNSYSSNGTEEKSTTARYSFRKGTVNPAPAKYAFKDPHKDSLCETPRKENVLKLNPNGKLLNSPIQQASPGTRENGRELKKRGRGRKKPKEDVAPLSRIAIMKYGPGSLSRQFIGGAIRDIMSGHTTYILFKQRTENPQSPPEPPKPTHPFFLTRQGPKKVEDSKPAGKASAHQGKDAVPNEQKQPTPEPRRSWPTAAKTLERTSASTKALNRRRVSDPIEPLWPPLDMVRIDENASEQDRKQSEHNIVDQKKAKGSIAHVSGSENILGIISRSLRGGCFYFKELSVKECLRQPKRILEKGCILRDAMTEKLDRISKRTMRQEEIELSANPSIHSRLSHPAVASLLSSIPTSRSSFEKGRCEELPWTQKYAPDTASKVLQVGSEALLLHHWLQSLTVSAVNTGAGQSDSKASKTPKTEANKKKKRKRAAGLDDFIVSSSDDEPGIEELTDDDDELAGAVTVSKRTVVRARGTPSANDTGNEKRPLSNIVLLSGPPGCGKTAAVYAVARELDFEVFEVNAGTRRSAKDVVERVGDMAQNHLVQILKQIDNNIPANSVLESSVNQRDDRQSSMGSFFKQKSTSKNATPNQSKSPSVRSTCEAQKPKTKQRQSLILLEEVDILFNEDKQFWNGVLALIAQSKRPIIMTCNDENMLPIDSLSFHAILRFRPPPSDLVTEYLSALCANECHVLDPKAILDLYTVLGRDLRATIMQLNYWCQMAVGSQKSGLDWIADRPRFSVLESDPGLPRILSSDTYVRGMDWLCRDTVVDKGDPIEKRTQLITELLRQWHISAVDWLEIRPIMRAYSGSNNLELLEQASFVSDMESSLDLLCERSRSDFTQAPLDTSLPPTPEKQRLDCLEGRQFLQADSPPDYTEISSKISATLGVLLENLFPGLSPADYEQDIMEHILQNATPQSSTVMKPSMFEMAFGPILDVSAYSTQAYHRPLSFEHGMPVMAEDVAPYIRFIIASELRIEQQRLQLTGLLSQPGNEPKRMRTTRASRAAFEGGDKATTRRERWFPGRVVPARVMATGGLGWENLLLLYLRRLSEEMPVTRTEEAQHTIGDSIVNGI
ncbi:hypothetical protein D8B26_007776 [Coccidioides posadasii str. Silveira]|uniref:Uncharacterized protein n=1 Tax=Coccidioides posadasii (strain RMSCC 757 / Silveira) TaxID=443226 RepID=E9D192_COCPS|nr:conserved hypothetical protein [Coccidioides posadasii str. Silveira]QVM13161.1 hypothetical protein D8B26_007776 [Coccidioides posadasii str. Silveira]